jgi:ABC-type nitrate/sulfonate/bicarbonate transport system permease component
VSLSELTTASAWIAGLAIVALIAAGWRKPARASADPARERRRSRERPAIELAEVEAALHQRTPMWRKIWALAASSTLAVVIGAIIATVVSFGIAFTVIRLTDMLRR